MILKCSCGNPVHRLKDGTPYNSCKACLDAQIKHIKGNKQAFCHSCYELSAESYIIPEFNIRICKECASLDEDDDLEYLYTILEDRKLRLEITAEYKEALEARKKVQAKAHALKLKLAVPMI